MKNAVTINIALIFLIVLFITFAILASYEMKTLGPTRASRVDLGIVSLAGLAALLSLIKGTMKWKRFIIFIVYIFIAVELIFQVLAVFGLLPRINVYSHVPFGRIYWTKEGFGNSTMNRYGWHCPRFSFDGKKKNIILIGDSMIQAVQVRPDENVGAVLERLVNNNSGAEPDTQVISLGLSGIGPAQYLELLKYSARHFNPHEVIIFLFLGNDLINSSYRVQHQYEPAREYIYYHLDKDGNLKMHDESRPARASFSKVLEYNHRNLFINAFRTLKSHCMTKAVLEGLAKGLAGKFDSKHEDETERNVRNELQMLGLDDFIFKKELNEDAREAIKVTGGLLELCRQFAISSGIKLRIVTIPTFTPTFFANYTSSDWSLEIGDYDFLLPERMLVALARENDISILPLGEYMYDGRLEAEKIKDLYFFEGSGHLSPRGHGYLANALYTCFYSE